MIYAISDIHGCFDALIEKMDQINLKEDDRIVFLGDYIDYGDQSYQVLDYIKKLQDECGENQIIVLKGNHEAMLLEWIRDYQNANPSELDLLTTYNEWLRTDSDSGFITFRTFISKDAFIKFEQKARTASFDEMNRLAVSLIIQENREMLRWIKKMPLYYETDNQIYVHAGVDEEAAENWKILTTEDVLLWKYPPSKGAFLKTIVAGHVGTGVEYLANDNDYHDVFYDGMSHYYIDGAVYEPGGKLNVLVYNEKKREYSWV